MNHDVCLALWSLVGGRKYLICLILGYKGDESNKIGYLDKG